MDYSAFDLDPVAEYTSLTNENLLSPDPTAPLPVATVSFGKPSVTPLPGMITPPGSTISYAVEDAEVPVWRLAVVLALKHRLVNGDALAGIAMRPQFPNRPNSSEPDLWLRPPNPQTYPATALPRSLPASEVERDLREGLPVWARLAEVRVHEFVADERRAVIEIELPPATFAAHDPQELSGYASLKQIALNHVGAAIGSVVVRVTDPATGIPLLTYAGDASWGQNFLWVHPLVSYRYDRALPPLTGDPLDEPLERIPDSTEIQNLADASVADAQDMASNAESQIRDLAEAGTPAGPGVSQSAPSLP